MGHSQLRLWSNLHESIIMKKNTYYILLLVVLLVALLVWKQQGNEPTRDSPEIPPKQLSSNGRDVDVKKDNKEYNYMPHQFFDVETPMPEFKKIAGNGVTIAKYFGHDIQAQTENFGYSFGNKIYEDHNKVEILVGEGDTILHYCINYGTYKTLLSEIEARKQFSNKSVGSIQYSNSFSKKYPKACYYQILHLANLSTNNWPIYYGDSPLAEIEIYPCTFTFNEYLASGGTGGEYLTHEGFLVISCVGRDYEMENDEITRRPVLGKIRRYYSLIGLRVNENAGNEKDRFDKVTANPGVGIWEDRVEEGK